MVPLGCVSDVTTVSYMSPWVGLMLTQVQVSECHSPTGHPVEELAVLQAACHEGGQVHEHVVASKYGVAG